MTWTGRRFLAAMGLAGVIALGGCAYDDGYYGGMSVGTGYYGGGYYDDYWGPGSYYPGYYSGWYNGYYYPGSGYYVYDRRGSRHRWNDGQRRYWEGRREARREEGGRNWRGTPRQWQRERGDWSGTRQRQWEGDRSGWRTRSREGSADATPSSPPMTQRQPDVARPRQDWGTRSDGARWRGGDGGRSGGDGTRGDGRRGWRR